MGGGEIGLLRLLEGLSRRDHEVALYCNHDAIARSARARGIEARISYLGGDIAIHHAWRFARELRELKPDALILGKYKKNWLAGLAARLAQVPRVAAHDQIQRDEIGLKYRFVFKNWVDSIVVNAESIRRRYIELGFDPETVITIHNGFDFRAPVHPPGTVRSSRGIPPDAFVVGSLGRLAGQKRFDRLLRAMALLPKGVHCIIAGEGEKRGELEALAKELAISDRVHLLGWRDDIPDVLAAFDVMAVSSDYEGLHIAMTEAMAAGVPIVSTPVSGAEEALEVPAGEEPPGIIVDFDPQAIADALSSLLNDPERRRDMGAAGRHVATERFSFKKMLDRWEAVLRGPQK